MKNLNPQKKWIFLSVLMLMSLSTKAQFLEKLADKAADAASQTLEKKVEEKASKTTDETFDKIFESDGKKEKKKKKNSRSDKEEKSTSSQEGNSHEMTQILFDHNSSELKTQKIPDLMKIANYLWDNPDARLTIKAHVESDENQADLSEYRAMAIKTLLVNKYELVEDFINIEICEPGKPNNRTIEFIVN